MKDVILLELANKWEADALSPKTENGEKEATIGNAIAKGQRKAKRECARALIDLVVIIGEKA